MDTKTINTDNSTSRKGGKRQKKNNAVKLIVSSLYVGNKPMAEAIGSAVIDSYKRSEEAECEAS